jgi:carboxypeptidase family protein
MTRLIGSPQSSHRFGLVCLTLSVAFLMGCDAFTSVQGVVRGPDNVPLEGAEVRLLATRSGKAKQRVTGSDGSFSVEMVHGVFSGPFRLEVRKIGYVIFTKDIEAKSQQQITVTLALESGNTPH